MYKVFLQFPEALKPAFPRLKEKLEDPDPGMSSMFKLLFEKRMISFTGNVLLKSIHKTHFFSFVYLSCF